MNLRISRRLSVLDRKLVRDLWAIRGQALAIALVVGAGVTLYVLMLSTLDSLELSRETYYRRYSFADIFASLERAPESLAQEILAIPGVARVETRVVGSLTLAIEGLSEPASGLMVSVPESGLPTLCGLHLREGRYLEPNKSDEVIVSARFAAANGFRPGDELVAILNGQRQQLQIVGIASSPEFVYYLRPGEFLPDDQRTGILWMGRRSLGPAFDMEGAFNNVVLTLQPNASAPAAIAELDRILAPYGALGAVERDLQISHWFLENELMQLRSMGAVVPAIFLAVAAFLLNVVLSRIVAVQREEIAAIKAMGYSNGALASHFLKWGIAIALLGSLLGVCAGAVLGHGMTVFYTRFFDFPILTYHLRWALAAQAIGIAGLAAALGAMAAVRRSVSLPPAEAMRPEPPRNFSVSVIERLGLKRYFSQPTRIIFRNLQRHPGRSSLSLIGIAAGGALLILGSFSLDAVERMTDLQFDLAQRYDVAVTLVRPTSAAVASTFHNLPGVLEVQTFRAVPVELRKNHRRRLTNLTSLTRLARLNRVIEASGRVVEPPFHGLVLSKTLAEVLELEPGDTVTVEVLEAPRGLHEIPVALVIDDLIGSSAFLEDSALHRLMKEGQTVSGAYLSVDGTRMDELFQHLKNAPRVAGVLRQNSARESLDATMDETVGTVRVANVLFAVIIAFGVVYNSTRITLSERSRELATLRVIGFRRSEISYILLGEVIALTVVAIPLGMAFGYGLSAATVTAMSTEVFRIPLVVSSRTYGFAAIVIILATAVSSLIVRRRLDRLDLVAVLKTRE